MGDVVSLVLEIHDLLRVLFEIAEIVDHDEKRLSRPRGNVRLRLEHRVKAGFSPGFEHHGGPRAILNHPLASLPRSELKVFHIRFQLFSDFSMYSETSCV